jgi:hypothetical protein
MGAPPRADRNGSFEALHDHQPRGGVFLNRFARRERITKDLEVVGPD